jgi:hypothetical protein
MNNTANTIVQYLQYLWKRKWLILLVTVLFAALGYVYEKTKFQETYRGSSYIFTGHADNDYLSKREFIIKELKPMLPKELKEKLDVTIPKDYQILITLEGPDSKKVESNLLEISERYVVLLKKDYNQQYKDMEEEQEALEEIIPMLEEQQVALGRNITLHLMGDNPSLEKQIESILEEEKEESNLEAQVNQLGVDLKSYKEILENHTLITKKINKYYKNKKRLKVWKPPVWEEDVSVDPIVNKPFLNPLTAAALGFQLMIVFLVLYKFFRDSLKVDRKREAKS